MGRHGQAFGNAHQHDSVISASCLCRSPIYGLFYTKWQLMESKAIKRWPLARSQAICCDLLGQLLRWLVWLSLWLWPWHWEKIAVFVSRSVSIFICISMLWAEQQADDEDDDNVEDPINWTALSSVGTLCSKIISAALCKLCIRAKAICNFNCIPMDCSNFSTHHHN